MNANSLDGKKSNELAARVIEEAKSNNDPHIIAVVDTKFDESCSAFLGGFNLHRKDRKTEHASGGVCIYFSDRLVVTETDITALNSESIEQIWRVVKGDGVSILVGCIYRPPPSSKYYSDEINTITNETLKIAKESLPHLQCKAMVVYGDLNFAHIRFEHIDVGGGVATSGSIASDTVGSKKLDEEFLDALEDNHLTQRPGSLENGQCFSYFQEGKQAAGLQLQVRFAHSGTVQVPRAHHQRGHRGTLHQV